MSPSRTLYYRNHGQFEILERTGKVAYRRKIADIDAMPLGFSKEQSQIPPPLQQVIVKATKSILSNKYC